MAKKITKTGKVIYKYSNKEMAKILVEIAKIDNHDIRLSLIEKLGL